jgi:hypothetical protein
MILWAVHVNLAELALVYALQNIHPNLLVSISWNG